MCRGAGTSGAPTRSIQIGTNKGLLPGPVLVNSHLGLSVFFLLSPVPSVLLLASSTSPDVAHTFPPCFLRSSLQLYHHSRRPSKLRLQDFTVSPLSPRPPCPGLFELLADSGPVFPVFLHRIVLVQLGVSNLAQFSELLRLLFLV